MLSLGESSSEECEPGVIQAWLGSVDEGTYIEASQNVYYYDMCTAYSH